jgi:hypothetical protein
LSGPEFVVDGVSRDGEYKCVGVWQYDKRPANGAPFVYYGMTVVDASLPLAQVLGFFSMNRRAFVVLFRLLR